MEALIKIIDNNGKQAVNSRELHSALGYDLTNYAKWAVVNINENQFAVDGIDYSLLPRDYPIALSTNGQTGQKQGFIPNRPKEYALSIDFAKKLAMIARTSKGEEVRNYFIEIERKASIQSKGLPSDYIQALKALVEAEEQRLVMAYELETAKPKVDFFDQVAGSSDAIEIGEAAKVMNLGIGRNRLFEKLRQSEVLMPNNTPYQYYLDRGWFRVVESKWNKPDGSVHISLKTMVYQKGLQGIAKMITQ